MLFYEGFVYLLSGWSCDIHGPSVMRNGHSPPRVMDRTRRVLAWLVHLYTATGLIAAAGMAVLLTRPVVTSEDVRWTFVLMLVATLIDATDGMLARWVRVKDVLPGFDGRRLDDIVDFLTYTALPLFLISRTDLLPAGWSAVLLLPLVASAYGFSQVSAKTPEGFFLGFPSYWNLVAFYLYVLPAPGWLRLSIVIVLALLTFVPSLYLYPTQTGRLNRLTNLLGFLWAVLLGGVLWWWNARPVALGLALASLVFPVYYLVASWLITLRTWLHAATVRADARLASPPTRRPQLAHYVASGAFS